MVIKLSKYGKTRKERTKAKQTKSAEEGESDARETFENQSGMNTTEQIVFKPIAAVQKRMDVKIH